MNSSFYLFFNTSLMWKVPEAANKESQGIQRVMREFRTLFFEARWSLKMLITVPLGVARGRANWVKKIFTCKCHEPC